jgi:hypothetical protein
MGARFKVQAEPENFWVQMIHVNYKWGNGMWTEDSKNLLRSFPRMSDAVRAAEAAAIEMASGSPAQEAYGHFVVDTLGDDGEIAASAAMQVRVV